MKHVLALAMLVLLSPPLAWSAAPLVGDAVDCVNPLSGTNGDAEFSRGNTVAAIVMPFGMTTWAPQTDGNASPFYQMKHEKFEGIRATHQPSIWVRDYGDFLIMPVVGLVAGSVADRASPFTHDQEIARPYFYSVRLPQYETSLELAPSERCAAMRFQFPKTDEAAIVFTVESEVDVEVDAKKRWIKGKATHVTFGAPGHFGKFFLAAFEHPFDEVEVTRDDKMLTVVVRLPPVAQDSPVSMRVGTSFIGYEQAELNLRREIPDWNFDDVKQRARAAWAAELARVEIQGASPPQRSTFYTALYRVLQFPRMFHEPDGEGKLRHYSPYKDGNLFDGPLYTDNGLWDTYRAAFPLFVLYYPEHSENILEGWLNAYREGGRLPNWPSPGNRPCMIGSHSDSIFADAWSKGLRKFDVKDAYTAVRKNAMENDPHGWAGRDHLDEYMQRGYIPSDARRDAATACTLEYAYGDYCVAKMAEAAGSTDEAKQLFERSQNYRNVWDAETQFMRGKLKNGEWQQPFDPLAWGGAYVEGNAYQWVWSVQHDPYGLIALLGGREKTAARLDELLTMPSTTVVGTYGHVIHEMREVEYSNMGQYAHINEPNHHVLYFYNYALQPWKAQAAVRRVMDELYDQDGMVGDEDTGQMSAWYVFNAAGFYPFCPGSSRYLIGSPLFEETIVRLDGDKSFVVRAKNNRPKNCYIQSATLNGSPFTRTWLDHSEIVAGGELEFVMGPSPNMSWGSDANDAPPNEFP